MRNQQHNVVEEGTAAFALEREGSVAVFRFTRSPLYFSSYLVVRDQLLAALRQCSRDESVRAILLLGFPEKAGSREYEQFFRDNLRQTNWVRIHRMLHSFSQLIEAIVANHKLVVFADSGPVISQFLNVSLACDYRVVGDNTSIQKAYLRHGMVPKGASAFFLAQLLGRSAALKLLTSEEEISAQQALELGLVDEVVPARDLEKAALAAAERFASMPLGTTTGLKRLMSYQLRGLSDYLSFETDLILRIVGKADFSSEDAGLEGT